MLYTLLTIGTILFLALTASYVVLRATVSDRPLRRLLMLFVVLTPPVAIFAFLRSLFFRPKPIPYSAELGRIEDEIESERASTFGGKIMRPSFSERWKSSYLYAVERSAAAAAKLNPSIDHSLCGIGHLR